MTLPQLISHVRNLVHAHSFNQTEVATACARLRAINPKYDYDLEAYPEIPDSRHWTPGNATAPTTLAEAMLWKLGRWMAYVNYREKYTATTSAPHKNDVVLYAFGQHLKNRTGNPIYDQHSLRALWAIDVTFNRRNDLICDSVLFSKKKGIWKESGSGRSSIDAYYLFLEKMKILTQPDRRVTHQELDKLLMPLGQALKDFTRSRADFLQLRQPIF